MCFLCPRIFSTPLLPLYIKGIPAVINQERVRAFETAPYAARNPSARRRQPCGRGDTRYRALGKHCSRSSSADVCTHAHIEQERGKDEVYSEE